MSTTLDASFLRTVVLVTSFRGDDLHRAQAALLIIGLQIGEFDAGLLPAEICGDDTHLAGIACGSLVAQKLIEACGRVKSSSALANGRKVNLYRIAANRESTVRTWLARHGYQDHAPDFQTQLAI